MVIGELRGLGLEVEEDRSAGPARAGAGNVVARLAGRSDGFVMLSAHLDTVPHEEAIEVELTDGVYRSRGPTILGADNKAAVTVLLELAATYASSPPPLGIELVFTVAEEQGLRGAKALDVSSLRAPFGFVFDHASPTGELIVGAPTYKRLTAEFEGSEAHAGVRPEQGRSAIAAAAAAVTEMKLGRLDDETTANVGVIDGGSAPNVVPGACRLEAEARSLDHARAAETIGAMVDACTWAAGEHGCDVGVEVSELFRAYRVPASSKPASIAREALSRCGHEPTDVTTGGGSDANAFIAAGFDCVMLANGTRDNHTPEESVAAERLVEMFEVCKSIVDVSATAGIDA